MTTKKKAPTTYAESVFFGGNSSDAAVQVLLESTDPQSLRDFPWDDVGTQNPEWPDREDDVVLGPRARQAMQAIYENLSIDDRMPATWAELKAVLYALDAMLMATFTPFTEARPGATDESVEFYAKVMSSDDWWPELVEPLRLYHRKDRAALKAYWQDNLPVTTMGLHWHIEEKALDDSNGRGFWMSAARLRKWRETGTYAWDMTPC